MTWQPSSPVPVPDQVAVRPGPALLAGTAEGPSLAAHRRRYGGPPPVDLPTLVDLVARAGLRGRGGAGFPFATKLATAARGRRPVVVVNLAEGEPASAKDMALALTRPHLVLDGAVATARALGADEVHLALPGERPSVGQQVRRAVAERDDPVRFWQHTTAPRFVAGQSSAVVDLMSGGSGLPTTTWTPQARQGYQGRGTLLSNAETWAQVGYLLHTGQAGYRRLGTADEPGTTLLTVTRTGYPPEVWEVPFGTRLADVLTPLAPGSTALVGGFHGAWASWNTLRHVVVSVPGMAARGLPLGAGVVHVLEPGRCPLAFTSAVVDYLAAQSAGQCGPCVNGLPALATAVRAAVDGYDATGRIDRLSGLLVGRGACAHPDGTVRLVRSLLAAFPDEVAAHHQGRCSAYHPAQGVRS